MLECRNDFFSKLQERKNTKKNQELRQEDTLESRYWHELFEDIETETGEDIDWGKFLNH